MFTRITETQFKDDFYAAGRGEQFSHEGLSALYLYLTDLEEDTGQELELDVVALCCEYTEEPTEMVLSNYGLESVEELQERTCVVAELDDESILYQVF
jgi:hypothetical protein